MSNLQVAFRAKQNAITEQIRTTLASWFPVMWLPAPVGAFGSVTLSKPFTTGSTQTSLSIPSLLFSVSGKGHRSTSRHIINGWEWNGEDMWVRIKNGKPTNIALMRTRKGYHIFFGSKFIGVALKLASAKRKAESHLKKARHN